MKRLGLVLVILNAIFIVGTVAVAQRATAPTRALPDATAATRILAADAVTFPSQDPLICYNGANAVVIVLDFTTGQGRFDFSAGLTQTFKCRN